MPTNETSTAAGRATRSAKRTKAASARVLPGNQPVPTISAAKTTKVITWKAPLTLSLKRPKVSGSSTRPAASAIPATNAAISPLP
jgi:hypothetical protein